MKNIQSNTWCVYRHISPSNKVYKGHPDYDKQQYEKHKEKRKKNAVDYYYNNRETILEKKKNNLDAKEKARMRAAKWREAHPNYMKEYMKEYNANKKSQEL